VEEKKGRNLYILPEKKLSVRERSPRERNVEMPARVKVCAHESDMDRREGRGW